MKLANAITWRVSLAMFAVLSIWAAIFYYAILAEVHDELDDQLEDFSTMLIQRTLAGEQLPDIDNGSNNTYFLRKVSAEYAQNNPIIEYSNEMVYIDAKREEEPARIVKRIFVDTKGQYFQVTVLTPSLDRRDMLVSLIWLLMLLYIALFVTITLVNAFVVHLSAQPLNKLLKWLDSRDIEGDVVDYQFVTDVEEFKKLSSAIEGYIKRSKEAFEQQKEFLGNASHELQTPIAVCSSRLELLAQGDLSEQQLNEVEKCLSSLSTLSKLNRSLLLLSRIENGEFPIENVDIGELVESMLPDYEEVYAARGINAVLDVHATSVVSMSSILARTMIANLLKNAFVHSVKGGSVYIALRDGVLTFVNHTLGEPLDDKKIFERFNQSGERAKGSSGLGLAISKAICQLYNFEIGYRFESRRHVFYIKLQ